MDKIKVTTDSYEYMGLKLGSVHRLSQRFPSSHVQFQFNGKTWNLDDNEYVDLEEVGTENQPIKSPIVSDGGSSSYYTIVLPDDVIEKIVKNRAIETEDILKYGLGNDFDFSNAGKSLIRLWGTINGAGKAGNDAGYEITKIRYSLDKIEKFYVNK